VLAEREGALLSKAAWAAQKLAEERLRAHGINVRQFGLLAVLARQGPMPQGDIGEALMIDRTSMVAFIDDLEAAGLVRRERNPDDRRAYRVTLTAEGKRLQKRAEQALDQVADEFFGPLTRRERAQLQGYLRRLLETRS
jgi:DNA-binding MarR family transcriptional regulator